jgi:hypothetical protein
MAGSRSEARPTLPEHLRGLDVPAPEAVGWLVEHGWPRDEAWASVKSYRKSAWWRAHRDARGEPPGRKLRWRGAAQELGALERDVQRSAVEEGKRSVGWLRVLGAWADVANASAWREVLSAVTCSRETLGRSGELVLELDGPPKALHALERERDRLEELARQALNVPVRLALQPITTAKVDDDRDWAKVRRTWWSAGGGEDWCGSVASLRCAGWTVEAGSLVVHVTGPLDALGCLRHHETLLQGLAKDVLHVPVMISWEPS